YLKQFTVSTTSKATSGSLRH
ncbi:OB-fold nucleic acid binding domain protein, partial [Vibrio parahaemolyticus V-223/04]